MKTLVEAGTNANLRINNKPELCWCVEKGYADVVTALLAAGASTEAANQNGDTPLILAACKGHAGIVSALLAEDAMKEATDKDRQSFACH